MLRDGFFRGCCGSTAWLGLASAQPFRRRQCKSVSLRSRGGHAATWSFETSQLAHSRPSVSQHKEPCKQWEKKKVLRNAHREGLCWEHEPKLVFLGDVLQSHAHTAALMLRLFHKTHFRVLHLPPLSLSALLVNVARRGGGGQRSGSWWRGDFSGDRSAQIRPQIGVSRSKWLTSAQPHRPLRKHMLCLSGSASRFNSRRQTSQRRETKQSTLFHEGPLTHV